MNFQLALRHAITRMFLFLLVGDFASLAFDFYANREAEPAEWMIHALQLCGYVSLVFSVLMFLGAFWFRGRHRFAAQAMLWWQVLQVALSVHSFADLLRKVGTHEFMKIQNYPSVMFYRSPEFFRDCVWSGVFSILVTASMLALFRHGKPRFAHRRDFAWIRFFLGGAGNALAGFVCFAFVMQAFALLLVEGGTGGGLVLGRDGVFSRFTTYAKGDQRVVVVPMIHIGDRSFYSQAVDRFASSDGLTLLEGVSGGGNDLKKLNHRDIASAVGVSAQSDEMLKGCKPEHRTTDGFLCAGQKMRYRYADLDFKDFKPITQAYLRDVGQNGVFGDIPGEVAAMSAPDAFLIQWDIEDNREDRLFREFDQRGGGEKLVVIPWGAAHSFRIGQRLENRGYKVAGSELVRVVGFGRLVKALLGAGPRG